VVDQFEPNALIKAGRVCVSISYQAFYVIWDSRYSKIGNEKAGPLLTLPLIEVFLFFSSLVAFQLRAISNYPSISHSLERNFP
jgi:hypothetical protein